MAMTKITLSRGNDMCKAIVIAALLGFTLFLRADVTWTGAANDGNKWSTGLNWQGGQAPTADDVAVFDVAATATINVDTEDAIAKQVKIAAASASVTFGGDGKLSLSCEGVSSTDSAQANQLVLNLNSTGNWTTFDCRVHSTSTGKFNFGPGQIYNGEVTASGTVMTISPIASVTPGGDYAQTLFRGGFSSSADVTLQVLNSNSKFSQLVIDGSVFTVKNYFTTVNAGSGTSGSHLWLRSGRFTTTYNVYNRSSGEVEMKITGGEWRASYCPEETFTNCYDFTAGELCFARLTTVTPLKGFVDGILGEGKVFRFTGAIDTLIDTTALWYSTNALTINGVYYVTNNAGAVLTVNNQSLATAALRGTGELWARELKKDDGQLTIEGLTLGLGGGGISAVHDGAVFNLRDVVLRLYEDVPYYTAKQRTFYFGGTMTIDTAGGDDGVSHKGDLHKVLFNDDLALTVEGGGEMTLGKYLTSNDLQGPLTGDRLTVADDTTLVLSNCTVLTVNELALGERSKLVLNAGYIKAGTVSVGNGAVIEAQMGEEGAVLADTFDYSGTFSMKVTVPSTLTTVASRYVISGGVVDTGAVTLTLVDETGSGYQFYAVSDGLYLGTAVTPSAEVCEWTGAADNRLSNPVNWSKTPQAGDTLYFSGFNHLDIVNDFPADTEFAGFVFRATAGPFRIAGSPVVLATNSTGMAVLSDFRGPLKIDCDVGIKNATSTLRQNNTIGRVEFNGAFTTQDTGGYTSHLYLGGTIAFGGTATIHKLDFVNVATPTLRVLDGGVATVVDQTSYSAQNIRYGRLIIDEGGAFNWADTNTKSFNFQNAVTHRIDGTVKNHKDFSLGADQVLSGKGFFNQFGNISGAENALTLNGVTLGALADWDFNAKALVIDGSGTIDTESNGIGYTVTMTAPIEGSAGEFIKSGRGTLVIAADSETVVNDFSGGITVNAGVLELAGPITSNIAGAVVFTGGELAVEQSVVTTMNDWTTLLRAESFAGLGEQAGKLMLRIIDGNAGEKLLQGRYQRSGGVVIIR